MGYPVFYQLLDQFKNHLTRGEELSLNELLEEAKSHDRWRNVAVFYSLRLTENFVCVFEEIQR